MSKREIEEWESEDFSESESAFEPQTLSDHFESNDFANDEIDVQTVGTNSNSNSNDQTKSKQKSKSKKKQPKPTNPFRFAFHTQKLVCKFLCRLICCSNCTVVIVY